MSDISDIPLSDVLNFLILNDVEVGISDDNYYSKAFKILRNPTSKKTIPIIEWMMAYNFLKTKTELRSYSVNEIKKLSNKERFDLSKMLRMKSDNIDHILNILRYMHKLTDYLLIGKSIIISKSSNIYDIFPEEIWIKILEDLRCNDIDKIRSESTQFKQLIDEKNIKEKIKMRGFPRIEGHCKTHDISLIISDDYKDVLDDSDYDLDHLLNELYDLGYNFVRGDLIAVNGFNNYRNEGLYIFNGCKILKLDTEIDDYGSLPDEFTIINNGVPVNYWYNIGIEEYTKGISHNNIVYFDHSSVKDQCLKNILSYDGELSTYFIYNENIYTILASRYEYDDESNISLSEFINILESGEKLIFDTSYEFGDSLNILELASYYLSLIIDCS